MKKRTPFNLILTNGWYAYKKNNLNIILNGEYNDDDDDDKENIREALIFRSFIDESTIKAYANPKLCVKNKKKLNSGFYKKRRNFLFGFLKSPNKYIQIIAYSYVFPVKAFRSFLSVENIDFQDTESFLRRLTVKQFELFKKSYNCIFSRREPYLPENCSKGWKTIWHKPTLIEILDEEKFDESTRFKQHWAVVNDDCNILDIGFTKYKGDIDDTINTESKFFVEKDHKNGLEKGINEFHVNPDGLYGITTRKLFGNYLWGDFEKETTGGWTCARFGTTVVIYLLLFVLSPIADIVLLFGIIDDWKIYPFLLLTGLLFPILILLYFLKFIFNTYSKSTISKINKNKTLVRNKKRKVKYKKKVISRKKSLIATFFEKYKKEIISFLVMYLFFYTFLRIFYDFYPFFITVLFDVLLMLYLRYCIFIEKEYVSPFQIPYGKYAMFLFITVTFLVSIDWSPNNILIKSSNGLMFYELVFLIIASIGSIFSFYKILKYYKKYEDKTINFDYLSDISTLYNHTVSNINKYIVYFLIFQLLFILNMDNINLIYLIIIFSSLLFLRFTVSTVDFLDINNKEKNDVEIYSHRLYDIRYDNISGLDTNPVYSIIVKNKWFNIDNPNQVEMVNNKIRAFTNDLDYIKKMFKNMDSNLLFELNCLLNIIITRSFSTKEEEKIMNALFNNISTVDIIKKIDSRNNNINICTNYLKNVIVLYFSPLVYIFKKIKYIFVLISKLIKIYIDFTHKWCAYSNESKKF